MFKEVADIKTSDQLHLPVPVAKFETVVAKPSEIQKEMVQELSKRAADIHSGIVDASVDNMLCVTNDGRKIGLDVRLMNPMMADVMMCFPFAAYASAVAFNAQLSDSLPPPVKYISSFLAPIRSATSPLA